MGNGNAPAGARECRREYARIVARRAAFEAVEKHERPAAAGEVNVDEVAVGRLPTLAHERHARPRPQCRRDGLQVADQCSVLGGASGAAACSFSAGAGDAWCTIMRQPAAVRR